MVDTAKLLRSPLVRAVLGSSADRKGGIERHIDSTVTVLKNSRSRVMDAGLKVAIENHAGDMQARELKMLIEAAGPEFVGVCLDSGNPVWTIEDPHLTLETLAPYVQTSHMRDSALWIAPEGAAVRWTRMGEGNMGMERVHPHVHREVPWESRLARSDRLEQAEDVQLSRSRILGALQGAAGVGVRALPGALRARQAVASRPWRSSDHAASAKRGRRRSEHQVDAGVSSHALNAGRAFRPFGRSKDD